MNTREFFTGRAIVLTIVLIIAGLIAGFYAFNNYIYNEKQGDGAVITPIENNMGAPIFTWSFEKANSLNLDGVPNTNIFLKAVYPDGTIQNKLIDTTPGSCNELPDAEKDSLLGSTNIQCYSAGLGYKFKITKSEKSYLVQRKTFEEATPGYNPPVDEYKTIAEFSF